jgi:O-antigen ligase
MLLLGIHLGAMGTSAWGVLQFWFNVTYIPQGPNPASTFVNRNFAAEFVACTLPFSFLLLARARSIPSIVWLAFGTGFNLLFLMMTGTRSALLAFFITAPFIFGALWLMRKQVALGSWNATQRLTAAGVLIAMIGGLGMIPTSNPKLLEEHATSQRGTNALARAFARTKSMTETEEYTERSFSVRWVMWKATGRIIEQRPLTGVGAGAWEVDIPLYQEKGSQLETDYYVHNEILQLLAEYGLVGWVFLIALLSYLSWSAWRTWNIRNGPHAEEVPWRGFALIGLLAFLVVSNAGFPWRLAATGAVFALALGILAASDARIGYRNAFGATRLAVKPAFHQVAALVTIGCLVLAAYITQQAAESEHKIVTATKIAMSISASGKPQDPRWDSMKRDMLKNIREGVAINPHYRKITPMVADELAKWGDWKNAVWVWESVTSSRPYVIAIMSNVARGYLSMGDLDRALYWQKRCMELHPDAPSVRSLQIVLLQRQGKLAEVKSAVEKAIADKFFDFDTLNAGYNAAYAAKEWEWAMTLLSLRSKHWPGHRTESELIRANIATTQLKDNSRTLAIYKALWDITPENERAALKPRIPAGAYPALGITL